MLEEFRRSGAVPPGLTRHIQTAAARRAGHIVTEAEVERFTRDWLNARLEAEAQRSKPVQHADDDRVEQAIATLAGFSPRKRPKEWAEALACVQQASREGRLTPAQTAQIDALDAVYAAKAG